MDTVALLLSAFILSITGLFIFIWSLRKRLFDPGAAAATVIFSDGEIGRGEEPAATPAQLAGLARHGSAARSAPFSPDQHAQFQLELQERVAADKSSAFVVFVFLACAVVWLMVASLAGLTSSIKLHEPDWLNQQAWLSFGRLRTIHLNAVAYGWAPMPPSGSPSGCCRASSRPSWSVAASPSSAP